MGSLPGEGHPTPVCALARRAADQPLQAARVRERGTLLRLSGSRQTVREDQRGAVTRQLQCEPQRDAGPDRVRGTRWARRGSRGARSGPELDGIARSVHDPAERRALTVVTGPRKADLFYRLWSLREALIKALGTGFSLNPSRFEILRRCFAAHGPPSLGSRTSRRTPGGCWTSTKPGLPPRWPTGSPPPARDPEAGDRPVRRGQEGTKPVFFRKSTVRATHSPGFSSCARWVVPERCSKSREFTPPRSQGGRK